MKGASMMAKRFLIPLDGTVNGEGLLKSVENLASPGDILFLVMAAHSEHPLRRDLVPGNPVIAVGADKVGTTPDIPRAAETRDQMIDRQTAETRDYLERVAIGIRSRGFHVEIRVELEDDVGKAIVNAAAATPVDVIAMHSRNHRGILQRLIVDDTEEVLAAGIAPVLVVP
jgi:nucleotide-binding universal stress UspA family protein